MAKKQSLIEHFMIVSDPRINRRKKHNLIDIIVIAICGVICSCETWVDIEEYGQSKEDWFKGFLELPGGIPSHDTFGRVFSLIDPIEFQKAFYEWTKSMIQTTEGEIIAMDGKYFRSSLTKAGDPRS
ncbi:MAG: ISAs1 family transposase, partial [Bacteriovoracaceae bacterium]|nr:ISAs1 family transposase [Bacteriovoracaceae bacterium]